MATILYLEMKEIVDYPLDDVGIFLRVEVADKADAEAKRPALMTQFFGEKPHTDALHTHVQGGSCTTEPLP